jgi:hypothetical protein
MSAKPKLRTVTATPIRAVNADESKSCVGSENDVIARGYSLLVGIEYKDRTRHPGRLSYEHARDVVSWACNGNTLTRAE